MVLDASVVVDALLGQSVVTAALAEDPDWAAPSLVDAEVGQVLRRHCAQGTVGERRAGAALDDLRAMPLHRVGHRSLLRRAFALRDNMTFYDALYVALAEGLGAPLLTRDARLARAAPTSGTVRIL